MVEKIFNVKLNITFSEEALKEIPEQDFCKLLQNILLEQMTFVKPEDIVVEVKDKDKEIKQLQENLTQFIQELAWSDIKYDAMQSTMGEFTGSTAAIPRYSKKYIRLWNQMFGTQLSTENVDNLWISKEANQQ